MAIQDPGPDLADAVTRLAGTLGIAPYDARRRLHGHGPHVVASYADAGTADHTADALGRAGFGAVVVPPGYGEDSTVAHAFAFEASGLRVTPRSGADVVLAFARIRLLVRGTRIVSETRTEVTKQRSLSIGRAVLSGGLVMTKTTTTERSHQVEERDGFLVACSDDGPDVIFLDAELLYDGLAADRQPTRTANFLRLTTLLREKARIARFDDRLLTRAGQAAVLGGLFEPEANLDTAVAVIRWTTLGA